MTNLETLKSCLFEVLSDPTENRCVIETRIPLLDDSNDTNVIYLLDLSDGTEDIFEKIRVSCTDGQCKYMAPKEVIEHFAKFVESDIVKDIYIDGF